MNKDFYNDKVLKEISQRGYYSEKIQFFTDFLRKNNNKKIKILDVACNDGYLTKLYSNYAEVIGNDINKAALKICRKRGLKCIEGSIETFEDNYKNYFDIVIAGDIIEHVFDTDKFLQSVKKVLKVPGVLLLTTPNLTSLGRRILMLLGKNPYIEYSTKLPYKEFNVGHIRYYTYKDLYNQLELNGFKNIKIFGDKINITRNININSNFAKHLPKLCRNLMVMCDSL